jgi:hypothetical protein
MSISMVFNQFLYGFTYIECFYDMNIYRSLYQAIVGLNNGDFSHHRIFDPFFSYIGIVLFSLFLPEQNLNKEKNEEENNDEISEGIIDAFQYENSSNKFFALIYDKNKDYYKDYLKNKKGIVIFILILILWIIEENLVLIYVDIFQDLDFWFFELIFISIIFSNHFIFKIYSHQKLSMALSIGVGSILKIYNISISLISEDEKIYKKYPLVFFFVILYFLIILARSYVNTQIKVFMDLKFITHRTLLMSYGLTGASLCFIAGIITSFVPCSDNKAIEAFVCKVKYNDNIYYDEIHSYIESSKNMSARLIIIVLGIISFFCNKFFYTLIIKNYTPIHVIFSFPMQFFIEKTFLLIFTAIFFRSHLFSEENQLEKFLLDISGDIASIIGFLIYLEIIELNFCKLNYNLKKNIISRGENDYKFSIGIEEKLRKGSADFSEESDAE